MAMTDLVASRAAYLHEAAHMLAVSSPAASAFLGLARNRLIDDTELEVPAKEWDALRRETCGACGSMFVPGWSCKISSVPKSHQKGTKRKSKATDLDASTNMVYQCLKCHRTTKQALQPQLRRHMKRSKSNVAKQLPIISKSSNEEAPKVPKTANASSKQRQKSRKGGLQAMLEKNKTQNSKPGLDLMDFMM
ncbi:hypothetical protein HBI56_144240 [Parastagonospora nodorum]|nr:hypothetical protein HBH53_043410 [Parastagonospora nodorum]KAH3980043.1 hypothetical protein HBH52_090610 [Parastagonospora nodorum]KAH4609937.1 hypothetical protein HBH82_061590 [Parastagonospora nodorum]KAH4690973.1 hypothetical protein HBH78_079390 [Parastagonospora nodorum]KAH4694741.1 hypothetical protein HBH67_209490 [Parastagonospora nodorum]